MICSDMTSVRFPLHAVLLYFLTPIIQFFWLIFSLFEYKITLLCIHGSIILYCSTFVSLALKLGEENYKFA